MDQLGSGDALADLGIMDTEHRRYIELRAQIRSMLENDKTSGAALKKEIKTAVETANAKKQRFREDYCSSKTYDELVKIHRQCQAVLAYVTTTKDTDRDIISKHIHTLLLN